MNKLRLEVLMSGVDRLSGPLKRMLGGTTAAARGVKDLRDKIKALNAEQAAVTNVQKQAAEYARLNNQLKMRTALLDGMRAGGSATAAQLKREEGVVRRLRDALDQQRVAAARARAALNAMGVNGSLTAAQERLRGSVEQTNAALDKQRQRFASLSAAQRQAGHMAARGAGMSAAGAGMLYGGMRAGHAASGVMGQARHAATEEMRIKALGLGEEESAKAIQFARNFSSYGTSKLDNLELMRDAVTVFNDRHHAEEAMPILADMKFANEAAFGEAEGADNSRKFMDMMKVIEMRGGANNKEDFERNANMVQQVITATGGRVGAADWMHVIQRGKLAAKGFDEKEFFYRLEPLVQEMGGNSVGTGLTAAYQNLYQGRTTKRAAQNLEKFGLIGDFSKVKHDKVGQTAQLNPGALKGADIFRRSQFEWMEKVLIPALRAKGIESEQETLDAIGSIFSNTNGGALMATMYQQRAMVQKGYELNSKAANIKDLKALGQQSPAGKEIDLRKRRDDLYAEMSGAVLPGYVKLLEMLASLTRAMSTFATEHPVLTKAMMYGAAGAVLLATGLGALAIPVGLLLAKGALLRMLMARLGVQFGLGAAASRVAAPAIAMLARAWAWAGGAVARLGPWLLRGAQWLGAWGAALSAYLPAALRWGAVLLRIAGGPVSLLALAASMLYSRWADVVGGFKLLMNDIGAAVMGAATYVRGLGTQFFDAGVAIVQGMANGITSRLAAVRDAISMVAGDSIDWFKEKLGIHSPSRVFLQLGGYVGEGAALGIERSAAGVRVAALGMAAAAMVPLAMPDLAAPAALAHTLPTAADERSSDATRLLALTKATAAVMPLSMPALAAPAAMAHTLPTAADERSSDAARLLALTKAAAGVMPPTMPEMAAPAHQARLMPRLPDERDMAVPALQPLAVMPTPAPVAPAGPGGMPAAGSTYQITINAAPGMDAQAIARAVAAELDRRERERDSRRFSRLSDID